MSKIKVYLAGTIYDDTYDRSWKNRFISCLPSGVFEIYDPDPKMGNGFEVIPRDKRVIENCDFVIAYVKNPSFGTTMEIKHAFDCRNVTTFVIDPTGKNIKNLWLAYHIHGGYTNVEDCAREMVATVNKMKVLNP